MWYAALLTCVVAFAQLRTDSYTSVCTAAVLHTQQTMKKAETKFLRRILPHYYEHIRRHPDTFLVRFLGMYRVKVTRLSAFVILIVACSNFTTTH
jgi:Phosphatidylinositol-4-phosphate 5-Kinase